MAIWTAAAAPRRVPSRCAAGASRPMQSTGRVVSAPIHALDRSRSAAMVLARGGTLAMAARRFAETATSASAMSQTGGRAVFSLVRWSDTISIPAIMPKHRSSRGVHDEVRAVARPVGREQGLLLRCPALPDGQQRGGDPLASRFEVHGWTVDG